MTSTERVMAAVNFQKPDRLPTWEHLWGSLPDAWRAYKGLASDVDPRDYYGIDISILIGDETFFPSQRMLVREEGDYEIHQDGWGRTIRTGKTNTYFGEQIDSVLREPGDLDRLTFEPAGLERRFEGFDEQIAVERASGRCLFSKIGGLYVRSHFLHAEDKLLMDMALDEGFCDALFDKVAAHLTDMALETLKRTNTWETGLWVYDDMANSNATMFSPNMFERYFLPRYKKLIETVRAAGCKHFFLHSDGNIAPVLDMLLDAGFEGFNPLEPRCGLDLLKLREKYGKRMVFFGGVCNTRVLPRGDKKEIEETVLPLIEMGREGGLVLGFASIGDDVTPEAYDFYRSLITKYGDYS
jgi:uroporphyrinogen decarboxylase